MQVLLYSKNFLPALGGLERNTLTIYQTLKKLGQEVTILTETLELLPDEVFEKSVVRTTKLKEFRRLIKTHDHVLVNGGIALRIIIPCILASKSYSIIYANATLYNQNSNKTFLSHIENRFRKLIAEKAKLNIALTHISAASLDLKNKKQYVLYNPIDTTLEAYNNNQDFTNIKKLYDFLFVGRIIEGKGLFLLLDAMKKLENQNIHFTYAIAGEGKDLERLMKVNKCLKYPANFLGRLDGESLIIAYHQSKVLILPSTSHIEGNPLVIAEAISCGLPVLASDQEAVKEVIGSSGMTFKNGDVNDLEDKMRSIVLEVNYKKFKESAFNDFIKFSMFNYEQNWKNILKRLQQNEN